MYIKDFGNSGTDKAHGVRGFIVSKPPFPFFSPLEEEEEPPVGISKKAIDCPWPFFSSISPTDLLNVNHFDHSGLQANLEKKRKAKGLFESEAHGAKLKSESGSLGKLETR